MHVEIDSFTTKFKLLLSNGYKATPTFESVEGEVFATLKAGLGDDSFFRQNDREAFHRKPRSPAYLRRQDRRKIERQQIMKDQTEKSDTNGQTTTDITRVSFYLQLPAGKQDCDNFPVRQLCS